MTIYYFSAKSMVRIVEKHKIPWLQWESTQILLLRGSYTNSHLLKSNLGWFLLSKFFSIRSERSCFSTPVAYSISPCRAVIIKEATLPRSRMEKLRWASKVRIKVNRKCFLFKSCPKSVKDFSTLAWTWGRENTASYIRVF